MTTLREAAEMALEALEWAWGGEPLGTKEIDAITALREALEQPEPGPLPVEEIIKIWNDMGSDPIAPSVFSFIACVRKTEQAHGIA